MAARRMGLICLLLCLCLYLMPCSALAVSTADAIEPIAPDQACSLTMTYAYNGTPCEAVPVQLYQIATVSANAQYTPTEAFRTAGLVLNGIQSSTEWNTIRSTLEARILVNAIQPDAAAKTNQAGQARFDGLKPGLYLAAAVNLVQEDGYSYVFDSALIALPGLDTTGRWQYQVSVSPKPDMLPPISPDEIIHLKVLKLWKGETEQSVRPKHIEVEIYRNGVLDRTVTLSEDNHWSYTWSVPKDNADWVVIERNVPDGYVVTMEERQTTFLLTNTWQPDSPPPGPNPPGNNPPGENPPGVTPPSDSPHTGDTPHIMLYTVLMYLSGAVLILLGITGKRKRT